MSLSIKSKIIFVSLFLSITSLISVSILSFISSDSLLRERVEDQLISESTGRGASIRSIIDTRIEQIRLLSANELMQNIVLDLQRSNLTLNIDYRDKFMAELESFRQITGRSLDLESVQILGKNGTVLLSSETMEEGVNDKEEERFKRAIKGEMFLDFAIISEKRKALVTVPIMSRSDDSKEPLGVVYATTGVAEFDEILLNREGLGRTGEVYIVNDDKLMVSESRFIENAAFRQQVNTLPVGLCFENGTNIYDIYPDYRDIPIVGFSYCAPDLGLVLLAEIDEAEIFMPITQLRDATVITAIAITGIVVAIAFYVSTTISRPITKLRDAADRISKGDYTYNVDVKSRDEIGRLAEQFNMMRKSVLETNLNLNRLVRDRTKDLTDMTNALDATAIVAVTDRDGNITKVNRKFKEISKYDYGELVGQNHRILKSGYHGRDFFENMWNTIKSGYIWEGEIKNKAKDGNTYWVKTTIVPFLDEDKQPKQYIAIHNDITNLKNIEEQLKQAIERNKSNAEIIQMQVEELKKTNIELRRKDKLKDEFLGMASHELKTPLTPIIGWCGALKSNIILGKLTDEQLSAVETIEKNAIKLEKMISDMLDVQKMELEELKFNTGEVNVNRMFKNLENDFELMMKEKNISFIIKSQPGLKLISDESRIMQVLSALIYNSVDFVPKNSGLIEVTSNADNGRIVFCVKDNGPGIPKDKQEYLFKKFYQVDTSITRKHGGTGLGLAISKGIVMGLGGTIWVETEEGKGSSFYFSLPDGYGGK